MLQILAITGPIYLVIAAGFLAVRLGSFSRTDLRVLGRLVVMVCMPALLFHTLATRDFAEVMEPRFLLAYALGSLVMLGGGTWWARRAHRRGMSLAAMQGLGMSQSNSAMIGFPIVSQVVGPTAAVGLALCLLVENMLIMPLAFALADREVGTQRIFSAAWQSLRSLARNPMIVAIVAGFVFSLAGWRLPAVPAKVVSLFAGAAVPVALFVVGGTLVGLQLAGQRRAVATVALSKLLLHPLAVAAMLLLIPVDPVLRSTAIAFAAMPMAGVYPVLAQRYGHEDAAAAALLVATVTSFFTVSGLLWALQHWPGALPA